MRGLPQTRTAKFKLFNCLSLTHEIFRISKYEQQIIFDKIWEYKNEGVSLKWSRQNLSVLTSHF